MIHNITTVIQAHPANIKNIINTPFHFNYLIVSNIKLHYLKHLIIPIGGAVLIPILNAMFHKTSESSLK